MRQTSRASLALSVLVVPAVLVAPVASLRGAPVPEPVAPRLHVLALPAPTSVGRASLTGGVRTASGERVVDLPARSTADFSTVGVTWRPTAAPPDLEVQVRTRTRGAWGDWVDLEGHTDDAPDTDSVDALHAGVRAGTRPAYVGPSDGVQVRVDVASGAVPDDLRVDLVDPGTSPLDDRGAGRGQAGPRDTAAAAEPRPAIVTRAEWGADESVKTCFSGYTGAPKVAFVHHTDSTNVYSPAEAAAAVRGFYAYHVKSNGWCDIGYNFLVDRYGTVYEGRAGGIEANPFGAHTGGFNTNSFGTAMIGDFTSVLPPAAMRASLARLIAWKLGTAYADPLGTASLTAQGTGSRFAAGTSHVFSVVSGHRDAVSTSCPGDVGYSILAQLRTDVRAAVGAALVTPSASPLSVLPGGAPVAVSAGVLQPLAWRLDVTAAGTGLPVRTLTGSADTRLDTAWDLRDDAGTPVVPGSYRLTLSGGSASSAATPWTATVTVLGAASPSPSPAVTALPSAVPLPGAAPTPTRGAAGTGSSGSAFVPVAPVRVLDTRDGTGGRRGALGAGETLDLPLAGQAGVPADATAVALNVTGTHASSGTHLTVWPAGEPEPGTSVLNLRPGVTAASLAVAGLGTGGAASVRNLAGSVDLVGDVVGYWTRGDGALYHPVQPARLLDSRTSAGGARRLADAEVQRLTVTGRAGVPSSATAVVLNVTAVGPTRSGYLTVSPSGTRTTTSSVNFAAGETVPNRVVSGLAGGAVDLRAAGTTHALVDVVGWFGPSSVAGGTAYTPVTPSRLVDSRDGTGTPEGAFGARTTRDVQVTGRAGVPAGAAAVVVSLTGTGPSASQTFVTAFPDATTRPGTSDLNLVRGQTRSNLAVVPLSAAGRMSLYNEAGGVQVIADVLGYYTGP